MTTLPHHCNGCTSRWGGLSTAHCTGCHRTFSGINAWEKHRAGSHTTIKGRYCVDPETVLNKKGEHVLALTNRAYPCWGMAGDKPEYWAT